MVRLTILSKKGNTEHNPGALEQSSGKGGDRKETDDPREQITGDEDQEKRQGARNSRTHPLFRGPFRLFINGRRVVSSKPTFRLPGGNEPKGEPEKGHRSRDQDPQGLHMFDWLQRD